MNLSLVLSNNLEAEQLPDIFYHRECCRLFALKDKKIET